MSSFIATLFASSIAAATPAPAHWSQVVAVDGNSAIVHAKVIEAAKFVCAMARASDENDDFGSQAECVRDAVDHAIPASQAQGVTQVSSR